jgi:propanediol utilization protein
VHLSPADAQHYGVKAGDPMVLDIQSSCPIQLRDVMARVDPSFKLEVHIDTDEGNACDLPNATHVELYKQK